MNKLKYGKLLFQENVGCKDGKTLWRMKCKCGTVKVFQASNVVRGASTSCGCEQKRLAALRRTKHGLAHTPTYRSWYAMIQRCKKNTDYIGRITVCKRWKDFTNFYVDMGERPPGYTIERKDNNKGYVPSNCKWATRLEQNRNTRHNVMLTYNGRAMCASAWAEELGHQPKSFNLRIRRGWTLEQLMTIPPGGRR